MPLLIALSSFATGILLGILVVALVAGGVMLVVVFGRRRRRADSNGVDPAQMLKMLQGLSQWTSGMSDEVNHYRDEVDTLVQRIRVPDAEGDAENGDAEQVLEDIRRANEALKSRLESAEATLQVQAEEISGYMSEARTDALTGLPNRRSFDDELKRRLAEFERHQIPVSLILLDIDHFKQFNDQHGHLAGDEVLKWVGRTLRHATRATDLVARFGGEEFAIILPNAPKVKACQAAERARRSIECEPVKWEGQQLTVTASCGVALAREAESISDFIHRADLALYASKKGGRNLASWHDGETTSSVSLQVGTPSLAVDKQVGTNFEEVCDNLRRRLEQAAGDN